MSGCTSNDILDSIITTLQTNVSYITTQSETLILLHYIVVLCLAINWVVVSGIIGRSERDGSTSDPIYISLNINGRRSTQTSSIDEYEDDDEKNDNNNDDDVYADQDETASCFCEHEEEEEIVEKEEMPRSQSPSSSLSSSSSSSEK